MSDTAVLGFRRKNLTDAVMKSAEEQLELLGAGMMIHQHQELVELMELPLRVAYTIPPSETLHFGHAVPFFKLRQFQQEGHQPVVVTRITGGRLAPVRKIVDGVRIYDPGDWHTGMFAFGGNVDIGPTSRYQELVMGRSHYQILITVPDLPEKDRVQLDDPAEIMYSKIMTMPEKVLEDWWTLLPVDDAPWLTVNGLSPIEIRHKLAERLVGFFYGQEEIVESKNNLTVEVVIHESELENGRMGVCNFLVRTGLATTTQVAKRLIHPVSSVFVGNKHVLDTRLHVLVTDGLVARVKKRSVKVRLYFNGPPVPSGLLLNGPLFPPMKF